MAVKKKKISELPLAQSLVGLFTIGVDALNKSVKVGLEFVKTAADNATAAAMSANNAASSATTAATVADTATATANTAAEAASAAAQIATQKAIYAGQKGDYANQQAEAAKEAATTIGDRIDMGLAALVGAAPDALDTLVELAEAIGNDPNFAQTMLNEISKRAMANDPRLSDARDVINQAGGAIKIWTGSQAQYNAIAKQSDTLYFIS